MYKNRTIVRNSKRSLQIYWQIAPAELIGYVLSASLQVAFVLTQTWFLGRLINNLIAAIKQGDTALSAVRLNVAILVCASVGEQICWALLQYFEKRSYHKWSRHNYFSFFETTSQMNLSQYENRKIRKQMNQLLQEGYSYRPGNFATELLFFFHSFVRAGVSFVLLGILQPLLVPILIIASIPTLIVEKRAAAAEWGIWGAKGDTSTTFWTISTLLHQKDAVMEIIPQGSRNFLLKKADAAIGGFLDDQVKILRKFIQFVLSARIFEGLVTGGISLWLLHRVLHSKGAFSVGQFSAYAGITQQFQSSISVMYRNIVNIFDYNQFMTVYYDFLDTVEQKEKPKQGFKLSLSEPVTIEFKDVTFVYPSRSVPTYKNLNLTIKPGEHIALVGANGAGKTTLIKLLMRFYDVTSGEILLNGHNIKEVDLLSWYHHIGALFQTFNKYPLTLDENVRIGRIQNQNNGVVTKALGLAGIGRMYESFEYGKETMLDPSFSKGAELSGGQWQKIALARAFYRDASILILDEPTSAVDAKAEFEIFEQIRQNQQHKTTIVVSHRFSTVRQAERIIVLDNGMIAEEGSHEELLKLDGIYKDLFEKQAAGYR